MEHRSVGAIHPPGSRSSNGVRRTRPLLATAYDGVRRLYQATAYPLFGAAGEMHGVVAVFWEGSPGDIDG